MPNSLLWSIEKVVIPKKSCNTEYESVRRRVTNVVPGCTMAERADWTHDTHTHKKRKATLHTILHQFTM